MTGKAATLTAAMALFIGAACGNGGGQTPSDPSPSPAARDGRTPTPGGPTRVPTATSPSPAAGTPVPATPAPPRPTRTPTARGAPTAVLQTPDTEVTGVFGSYCWQDTSSRPAICADTFGFPKPEEELTVAAGQRVALYFTRPAAPDRLVAKRYEAPAFDAPKHEVAVEAVNPTSIVMSFPAGEHWLEVAATWDGHGMVPYYFKIVVR